MEKITFKNLNEIENYKWVGNAYSDMPAFLAIDKFIETKASSSEEACKALDFMGKGMDVAEPATIESLKFYLNETGLVPQNFSI